MRKLNSNLAVDFISEQGNDAIEKTYVAYTPLENFMCIAVAESYDNEVRENSARLAVEAALTAFERKPSLKRIREYLKYANEQVLLHSTRHPLKVSITVFVTDYTRMRYGVCGNTRLYEMYENLFTSISRTQTKYQQLMDEDAGRKSDVSEIHNLTQYLGKGRRVKPFVSKKMLLTEGSAFLFATSNLWCRLSEIEILDAYENAKTNAEFLENLQELLLSRQDQGSQKIGSFTAAVLLVEKTFKEDVQKERKKRRLIILGIAAVIAVILIFFIAVLVIRANDRRLMGEINERDKKGARYVSYENYTKALGEYEQAAELAAGLSLNNWQYTAKKKEIKDKVLDRKELLAMLQDGEAAFTGKDYEQARKLYAQVRQEASYQEFYALAEDAAEKLKEIDIRMQISQYVTLGDMYASTEDHKEALEQYAKASELLGQITDLETLGSVQSKIYEMRQKLKETKEAQEAARQEEEERAGQKAAIQINALIANANRALDEGRLARARKLYRKVLAQYNKYTGSGDDADKLYEDITALGQAIVEAEAKAKEDALNEKLKEAAKYSIQAKEAGKKGDRDKAVRLYRKALKIYKELDIWDERAEEIYEAIDALEQEPSPTAAPKS